MGYSEMQYGFDAQHLICAVEIYQLIIYLSD